jgi:hypothetical protein
MLLMISQSIFSYYTTILVLLSSLPSSPSSEFLSLAPVSYLDGFKVSKRLRPSKSVGVDDIPGLIIKGCTDIIVPVLKHIFNLSLSQQYFRNLRKQAESLPVLKKGNSASVTITDPYPFSII